MTFTPDGSRFILQLRGTVPRPRPASSPPAKTLKPLNAFWQKGQLPLYP